MDENPLVALRDMHLPPPVSFWPPAPGWWIMIGLFLILCLCFVFFHLKTRRYSRLKREALRLIQKYESRFLGRQDAAQAYRDLSLLTRRLMVTLSSDPRVAGIHGERWPEFLLHVSGGSPCTTDSYESLRESPFCAHPEGDPLELSQSLNNLVKGLPLREKVLRQRIDGWFGKTATKYPNLKTEEMKV